MPLVFRACSYREAVVEFKRTWIISLLERTNWNVARAAREEDFNRTDLHHLIAKLGITLPLAYRRGPGNWGNLSDLDP